MKNKIKLTLLFALVNFMANAQTTQLKEMLATGLENNYALQIVRAEKQQSENNATLMNSGMLPTISTTIDYDYDNEDYDITYRADNSSVDYVNNDHAFGASLDLSWTIFNGFSIRTSYKKNKELVNLSNIETKVAVEDYIASFTAEYFNAIKQNRLLKNLKSAMELSGERLRIVKARYSVGTFSRLDFLQSRVDFNADSAAYIKQMEVVYTSSVNLSKMMADSLSSSISLKDSLINVKRDLNYETLLNDVLDKNIALQYAKKNVDIVDLDLKSVLSRDYPYLKLAAGYQFNYNAYSRNSTLKSNYHGAGATLTLGFNIFDPTKRAAKRNAIIDKNNAKLLVKDAELDIKAQLMTFYQAYLNNLKLLKLESASLYFAKENYQIANERYLLGDLSGIEMREAENSLLDAENRILDALYDTKICEISLLQISGNLDYYL